MTEVFAGREERLATKREQAASILALYAEDQVETLGELLFEADEKLFPLLWPKLKAHGDKTLVLLNRERNRTSRRGER